MQAILQHLPPLLMGTLTTLELMCCALLLGTILTLIITWCVYDRPWYLTTPFTTMIFFIKGTPMLVQFFIIYYGSGQFEWIRHSVLWNVLQHPFACAAITLAINSAAYTTGLLCGAIKSVPKTEVEACLALGMSKLLALRKVIVPHAIRIVLPAYSNEVIVILKSTSLASAITLMELTGIANQLNSQTYATIEIFAFTGAIYLSLNLLIIKLFGWWEKKLIIEPLETT